MSPALQSVLHIVNNTALWSPVIPLALGGLRFRFCNLGMRVIVVLMGFALVANLILKYLGSEDNFTVYLPRIYTVLEFSAITIFFLNIVNRRKLKIWMTVMFLPFCLVVVLDFLVEGLTKRDELAIGLEAITFIIYALVTFYLILRDAEYSNIMATSNFWVISAVLLYFGGGFFIFISTNYVGSLSVEAAVFLWGVHAAICILFYSLMAVGIWKVKASQ